MEIFIKSLEAILILIGLGFFGFYLLFKRLVKQDTLKILSPIAIDFAVPAMIFSDIMKNFQPDKIPNWWLFPVLWFIFFVFGTILSYLFSLFVNKTHRKEFILSLVYPNALFIPIVLIANLYGETSEMLVKLYLFTLFFPIFLFNLYKIFLDIKNIKFNIKILFHPVIIITIAGIIIKIWQLDKFIPDFIVTIATRIGNLAIPIILLIVGGNLYIQFKNKSTIKWSDVIYFVTTKNILFPLIHLIILKFASLPSDANFLIFLQSAVPPVTAIPILIEREKGNYTLANQYLFFSFILSVITLPLMLTMFNLFL